MVSPGIFDPADIDLEIDDVNQILDHFVDIQDYTDVIRFVLVVWASEKEGKSHLIGTASELVKENPNISEDLREMLRDGRMKSGSPLWVIDTEGKFGKLKIKFERRDIKILPIWTPSKSDPAKCDVAASLKKLILILRAMSTQPCGTLAIDSWTDPNNWARKLIQENLVEGKSSGWELGELIGMRPSDYEVRNDIMSFIMYYIQNCIPNMHVILTARADFEWALNEKGKLSRTSKLKKKLFKETMYFADLEVNLQKIQLEDGSYERVGRLVTTEFDAEDPVDIEIVNMTYPKLIDEIKFLAIKRRQVTQTKKVKKTGKKKKKTTKKKANKKAKKAR